VPADCPLPCGTYPGQHDDHGISPSITSAYRPCALGLPVTIGEWMGRLCCGGCEVLGARCGYGPERGGDEDCGVKHVSWNDAQQIREQLSHFTKKIYRQNLSGPPSDRSRMGIRAACSRRARAQSTCGANQLNPGMVIATVCSDASESRQPLKGSRLTPNSLGLFYDITGGGVRRSGCSDCWHRTIKSRWRRKMSSWSRRIASRARSLSPWCSWRSECQLCRAASPIDMIQACVTWHTSYRSPFIGAIEIRGKFSSRRGFLSRRQQ